MSGEPAQNHGIPTPSREGRYRLGVRCLEELNQKGKTDEKLLSCLLGSLWSLGRFCRGWLFRQGNKAGCPTALP